MIQAAVPTQVVDGVVFDNLVLAGQKRESLQKTQIEIDLDIRNVTFQ